MIRFLGALLVGLALASTALAQPVQTAVVVSSCGNQSFTSGQRQVATMDTAGNWCTNSTGGGGGAVAVNTWATGTLGAMANYGTSPGAVLVPGVNAFITNTPAVSPAAATTGGASNFHVIAAASDNHQVVKNGAGTVYDIDCTAGGTNAQYVRLYDAGTGFNGCNSATNLQFGMICPAAATASGTGAGFAKDFGAAGRIFSTGISLCITGSGGSPSDTGTSNADTTTTVNIGYK